MAAFGFPQRQQRVASAGCPVLKTDRDQEYSVIRLFEAQNGPAQILPEAVFDMEGYGCVRKLASRFSSDVT
jgi:hypothetical protein